MDCSMASSLCGAALVLMCVSPVAYAQPGAHVRVGSGELVPKISFGPEFETNVYHQEKDTQFGASIFLKPSATLELERREFRLTSSADYHLKKFLSKDTSNLDQFLDGGFGLNMDILPHSIIGVGIGERFDSRSGATEAETTEDALMHRTTNDVEAFIKVHPGSALGFDLGGHFKFDDRNLPPGASANQDGNYNTTYVYGPELQAKWRFFPRTAILLQGFVDWYTLTDNYINISSSLDPDVPQEYLALPDAIIWKVHGGLVGRITQKLGGTFLVGYNSAIYDETVIEVVSTGLPAAVGNYAADSTGFENFTTKIIIDYSPKKDHKIDFGYDRSLQDSYFTNYLVYNTVFLKYQLLLNTRLGVGVKGGLRGEKFVGQVQRTDIVTSGEFNLAYAATEWIDINGVYRLDLRRNLDNEPKVNFNNHKFGISMTMTY